MTEASSSAAPLPKRQREEDDDSDLAFDSEEETFLEDARAARRVDAAKKSLKTEADGTSERPSAASRATGLMPTATPLAAAERFR